MQVTIIQAIGLEEAKLSSEIENIVTTNDELFRGFAEAIGGRALNLNTKEVLRYKDALWVGFNSVKKNGIPLSTRLFEEMFQIIKMSQEGVRRTSGTKLKNPVTDEIIYSPPEGENILREKLFNLETFIHTKDDLDPLVKMAVMHYQFEAIHPFTDGNGRTGRILNLLYLIEAGLLDIPVLYLSRYIIEHKNDYYKGLRLVTEEGAWEEWILYMLDAIEVTAHLTKNKVVAIRDLMQATTEKVKKELPKIYTKDLIEAIFQQPYCRIRFLEKAGVAQRQTAARYLKQLADIGIFRTVKAGREVYYINDHFFKILSG